MGDQPKIDVSQSHSSILNPYDQVASEPRTHRPAEQPPRNLPTIGGLGSQ
jgi:hypothetical protein